jgi:hypothetical protein
MFREDYVHLEAFWLGLVVALLAHLLGSLTVVVLVLHLYLLQSLRSSWMTSLLLVWQPSSPGALTKTCWVGLMRATEQAAIKVMMMFMMMW